MSDRIEIGDRVRYVGPHRDRKGKRGTVVRVGSNGYVKVDWGDDSCYHPFIDNLIVVREDEEEQQMNPLQEAIIDYLSDGTDTRRVVLKALIEHGIFDPCATKETEGKLQSFFEANPLLLPDERRKEMFRAVGLAPKSIYHLMDYPRDQVTDGSTYHTLCGKELLSAANIVHSLNEMSDQPDDKKGMLCEDCSRILLYHVSE